MNPGTRSSASDPTDGFDATIHAPNRLRICALLDTADEAEFAVVQKQLDVSASVLSKHVTVLTEAGYVEQRKALRDTRQRVWLRLTREGRQAYQAHLAALRAIVGL
ncbi:MarR family transcriptional regulator [Streptomyces cellostaticus]|uniref:MarR family transcriptional regulator n=1 Tax=Streptomyces cellostaticus TaxID=67285 RepID=A0A101NH51_9ACTN|nr:transcriptional regulator [Streptomyces cellostaticus]KUM93025.1 MarR family transcriptional regulator [Streptomyces cellostaticus]GHI06043.1 MarR family transcriptional regulator [Streptomyces cellostaticus]